METAPIAELEPARREALLAVARPLAGDIAVIGYYRDPEHWLLLTLDLLYTSGRSAIATSDIATARFDDVRAKQPGVADAKLGVVLTNRETVEVGIESGAPLMGLLNVLKRMH